MNQKEREMLVSYLLNTLTFLEDDQEKLLQRVKYMRSDSLDLLELLLAKERLNMFRDFSSNVMHILHIFDNKEGD